MARTVDVAQARSLTGLRLVLPEVPGPWAEGARGLFRVKGVPFARVHQEAGGENAELVAWTGESNAPQAVWEDEPARTGWSELVWLAERLAPEPALVPRDAAERAELFGLLFLLCGEEGFGWQRRLMMFHQVLELPETVLPATHPARQMVARLGRRYGYRPEAAEAAPGRCAEILRLLGARLEAQRTRGRTTLLGNALTALDIYWAAFAAMIEPLPQAQCPMPDAMRAQYTVADGPLREAAAAGLLEHRDRIYREHIGLPVDL